MSGDASGVVTPPAKPASWWEDYIDIFYAPSQVFARRMHSGFGVPMLVVTVLIGAIFLANSSAMQPIMDAEFARAMAKQSAKMTPEQMEAARSIGAKFAKVGVFFILPITMFLVGLTLWIIGKIFGAKQTLGAAFMVAAYAYVPKILEAVLGGVQLLLLDSSSMNGRYKLSLGVGRFLDPDTAAPALVAFLGRVDVFTIWVTILLGIGLSVTGKISRSNAMMAAVIIWFIGAAATVLPALR